MICYLLDVLLHVQLSCPRAKGTSSEDLGEASLVQGTLSSSLSAPLSARISC